MTIDKWDKTDWKYSDMFPTERDKEFFANLAAKYRVKGTSLAEAGSRIISSIMTDQMDGQHRLALAIADWYKTIGDERLP